jgi:hypothetical protein
MPGISYGNNIVDTARVEKHAPAARAHVVLGLAPAVEPPNVIVYLTQEPRKCRDPSCPETRQQAKRGA